MTGFKVDILKADQLGEADAALHALGKFADGAAADLVEADHFEQLLGALVALAGRELATGDLLAQMLFDLRVDAEAGFQPDGCLRVSFREFSLAKPAGMKSNISGPTQCERDRQRKIIEQIISPPTSPNAR